MNYIKQLQSDRASHARTAEDISMDIQHMLEYLNSSKFHVDTTVQVSDILHLILPLRNSVSWLASDLRSGVSERSV